MFEADTHATFVAGELGRDARLALWPTVDGVGSLDLVLPEAGFDGVAVTSTRVQMVPLAEVLDELVQVGLLGEHTRSVRALAEVARTALRLIAEGRLHPAIAGGLDAWALSPLNSHDRAVRAALVDWLPPEAHCLAITARTRSGDGASTSPPRMTPPRDVVVGMWHAVADLLPRTEAAALVSGIHAWADPHETRADVRPFARWLPDVDEADRAVLGLRVATPDGPEGRFRVHLQVRSGIDANRAVEAADLWAGAAPDLGVTAESDVLLALRRGAQIWPPLERLLHEAAPSSLELDDDEATAILGPLAVELGAAGIEVLVPKALTRRVQLRGVVESLAPPGAGDTPSRFGLDTAAQLTWRAELDGEPLTDDELALLAAAQRPVVKLRDDWVRVDHTIAQQLGRREELSAADTLAAALSGTATLDDETYEVVARGSVADLAERLRRATEPHEAPPPEALDATLRPYQRRGVAWMSEMVELGLGGVLADDMGLGKTIQLIALHLLEIEQGRSSGPTLVVCPATVVSNWERELARFAPGTTVHRFHGTDRSLEGIGADDIVVTTYGVVRRDAQRLSTVEWGLFVADEVQHAKNPNTRVARALRHIPARTRFGLTGTPIENRLTELWSLLDWSIPGILGDVEDFRRRVAIPIERDRDAETTERFSRVIAPFLLRRRKDDPEVVPDLPPKTETDHLVALTAEQAGLYRATVDEIVEQVERAEGIARRGLVLKLLTALKQICNHPAHYLHQQGPLADRSGKLELFDELVESITDAGDATLVFTQFVVMGELLVARLAQLGIGAAFLHGGLSLTQRTDMVDRFAAGEFPVFVLSLRAGGTGLNLTRATHVVHYDRWWNPAVENQASDRAWRIGQDRPVQIHRLVSEGTLEERIAEVLREKSSLADAVTGSGETWITELDDDELLELVQLSKAGS
jgi:superfamily II DNA or RNA helicase